MRLPDIRTCRVMGKNFSEQDSGSIQGWVGFANLRLAVRAMCLRCQSWCILRVDKTPRHSNLLSCKKFVLLNNFGPRAEFDLQDFDCLPEPCACDVSCEISWGSMRHPDIWTCSDWEKIFSNLDSGSRGVPDWNTETLVECQVHVRMRAVW